MFEMHSYTLIYLVSHDASLWTTSQVSVLLSKISTVTKVLSLCNKREEEVRKTFQVS